MSVTVKNKIFIYLLWTVSIFLIVDSFIFSQPKNDTQYSIAGKMIRIRRNDSLNNLSKIIVLFKNDTILRQQRQIDSTIKNGLFLVKK